MFVHFEVGSGKQGGPRQGPGGEVDLLSLSHGTPGRPTYPPREDPASRPELSSRRSAPPSRRPALSSPQGGSPARKPPFSSSRETWRPVAGQGCPCSSCVCVCVCASCLSRPRGSPQPCLAEAPLPVACRGAPSQDLTLRSRFWQRSPRQAAHSFRHKREGERLGRKLTSVPERPAGQRGFLQPPTDILQISLPSVYERDLSQDIFTMGVFPTHPAASPSTRLKKASRKMAVRF